MQYAEDHPFYRLLATKYDDEREQEGIEILDAHPELAKLQWPGPDEQGKPFIRGSTALHYAANDGKLRLVKRLLDLGADINASEAHWYRSVLSWAANNARNEVIDYLLAHGAAPDSLDAMHAAAWGGSSCGAKDEDDYVGALQRLLAAGADLNDRRNGNQQTPLYRARESGHQRAIAFLASLGAEA